MWGIPFRLHFENTEPSKPRSTGRDNFFFCQNSATVIYPSCLAGELYKTEAGDPQPVGGPGWSTIDAAASEGLPMAGIAYCHSDERQLYNGELYNWFPACGAATQQLKRRSWAQ